jgi:hypothetical protein
VAQTSLDNGLAWLGKDYDVFRDFDQAALRGCHALYLCLYAICRNKPRAGAGNHSANKQVVPG